MYRPNVTQAQLDRSRASFDLYTVSLLADRREGALVDGVDGEAIAIVSCDKPCLFNTNSPSIGFVPALPGTVISSPVRGLWLKHPAYANPASGFNYPVELRIAAFRNGYISFYPHAGAFSMPLDSRLVVETKGATDYFVEQAYNVAGFAGRKLSGRVTFGFSGTRAPAAGDWVSCSVSFRYQSETNAFFDAPTLQTVPPPPMNVSGFIYGAGSSDFTETITQVVFKELSPTVSNRVLGYGDVDLVIPTGAYEVSLRAYSTVPCSATPSVNLHARLHIS